VAWCSALRCSMPSACAVRTYGHSLADVQGKRRAAKRWASHVTAAVEVEPTWRYLLVSETEIAAAKCSWPALKVAGLLTPELGPQEDHAT
jgi:hypothetical protein